MQSPGLPRLDIDVRERRTERWIAAAACALALFLPWLMVAEMLSPLFAFASGVLAAAVMVAGFHQAGWWGGARRIERVIWDREGQWLLLDASGRIREAQLAADTRIGPGCVWLRWQTLQPRSLLLLLCDVPADQLRRLSVRLRIDRRPVDALPPAAI